MEDRQLEIIVILLSLICDFVEMRTNVALKKISTQSSIFHNNNNAWGPHKANDGDRNQIAKNLMCAHTKHGDTTWWTVDLGQMYYIDSVTIYNRVDCCKLEDLYYISMSERLADYFIYIYHQTIKAGQKIDRKMAKLCYYHEGKTPAILNVACNNDVIGRYIQIYKPKKNVHKHDNVLVLCEVEVYTVERETAGTGRYCQYTNRRPLLSLDIQVHRSSKVECSLLCMLNRSCLGYTFATDDTCVLNQSSENEASIDAEIKYFERC